MLDDPQSRTNNNPTRRSVLAGLFGTTMLTQAKAFGDGIERILLLWGDQSANTFILSSGSYLGMWDDRVSSATLPQLNLATDIRRNDTTLVDGTQPAQVTMFLLRNRLKSSRAFYANDY